MVTVRKSATMGLVQLLHLLADADPGAHMAVAAPLSALLEWEACSQHCASGLSNSNLIMWSANPQSQTISMMCWVT